MSFERIIEDNVGSIDYINTNNNTTVTTNTSISILNKFKNFIIKYKILLIIINSLIILGVVVYLIIKNTKKNNIDIPEPVITTKIRTLSPNSIVFKTQPTYQTTTSIRTTTTTAPTRIIYNGFNLLSLGANSITNFINLLNYDMSKLVSTSKITISANIADLTSGPLNIYIGSYKTNIFNPRIDQSPLYSLLIFLNPNISNGFGFRRRAYNIIDNIILQQTFMNNTNILDQTTLYNVEVVLYNFNNVRGTLTGIDNATNSNIQFVTYPIISPENKYCNIKMTITNYFNNEVYTIPETITWYNNLNLNNVYLTTGSGESPNGRLTVGQFKTTIIE